MLGPAQADDLLQTARNLGFDSEFKVALSDGGGAEEERGVGERGALQPEVHLDRVLRGIACTLLPMLRESFGEPDLGLRGACVRCDSSVHPTWVSSRCESGGKGEREGGGEGEWLRGRSGEGARGRARVTVVVALDEHSASGRGEGGERGGGVFLQGGAHAASR
eukprot:3314559-Rhodomonas_salina.1